MKRLWLRMQYWMLLYLFRRHRPFDTISSAGPPTGHYDTYWVFVVEDRTVEKGTKVQEERRYAFLIKSSSQGHLLAQQTRESDRVKPHPRFKIDPGFFTARTLELQHYYRNTNFIFRSVLTCFLARIFHLYWFIWAIRSSVEACRQWLYAKRFKVVNDRIDVLRAVIALRDEGVSEPHEFTVARFIHGDRFVLMEDHEKVTDTVERLLDSLVADDYLEKSGAGYRAAGKSFSGLLALEGEIRREKLAWFSQMMMVILTLILALSSIVANILTYLDLENKPF